MSFIFIIRGGYAGVSTNLEIGYAAALDKPIYAYDDNDDETCRQVLFRAAIETPEDLIKQLK